MTAETPTPREFPIAPEYRRVSIYAMGGALIIVCLTFTPGLFPRDGRPVALGLFGIAVLPVLVAFRWRIRVDTSGLWRRRLVGWEHWPWTAFERGEIDKTLGRLGFVWPTRPWWTRTLTFDLIDDADRETLFLIINARWHAPPPPPVPQTLTLGWRLFSSICLTSMGIRLGKRACRMYDWNDVTLLRIERIEHDRMDFQEMLIQLPDRTLHFHVGRNNGMTTTSWSGTTPQVLAAYVQQFVPPERVSIISRQFRPRTADDLQGRLERLKRQQRDIRQLTLIFSVLIPIMLGLAIWQGLTMRSAVGAVGWMVVVLLQVLVMIMVNLVFRRDVQRRMRKVESEIGQFSQERPCTSESLPLPHHR